MMTPMGGWSPKAVPMRQSVTKSFAAPQMAADDVRPPAQGMTQPAAPAYQAPSQPQAQPAAPAFDPRMGGGFSQTEGVGATMTPAQIAAYGDPEGARAYVAPGGQMGQVMQPGQQAPDGWTPYSGVSAPPPAGPLPNANPMGVYGGFMGPEQYQALVAQQQHDAYMQAQQAMQGQAEAAKRQLGAQNDQRAGPQDGFMFDRGGNIINRENLAPEQGLLARFAANPPAFDPVTMAWATGGGFG